MIDQPGQNDPNAQADDTEMQEGELGGAAEGTADTNTSTSTSNDFGSTDAGNDTSSEE